MKMMNSQGELTIERPESFIGSSAAEICGAYLELHLSQTRVQHGTCIWKHPTQSSRFKIRVFELIKGRVFTAIESHVSTIIESRVSTVIESHISTSLNFMSAFDQHDGRIYESCVLSHRSSMSLLLQSV